jgi:hydroxymethylglutaryl-CoA reductase
VVPNPELQKQMLQKIIELKMQALEEIQERETRSTSATAGTAEFGARYANRANRALESAVTWFLFLVEQNL